MAKVGLTKLGLTVNKEVKELTWNDQIIEIKQYLPAEEKLQLCSRIINLSVDDNNYYNPAQVAIYQGLETLIAYTNINITEKQKENPCKLFDLLYSTGMAAAIYKLIPENELAIITSVVEATIDNIYKYKNSAMGVIEAIGTDYSDLDLDASNIQQKLTKGEGIELLKEVVTKLG